MPLNQERDSMPVNEFEGYEDILTSTKEDMNPTPPLGEYEFTFTTVNLKKDKYGRAQLTMLLSLVGEDEKTHRQPDRCLLPVKPIDLKTKEPIISEKTGEPLDTPNTAGRMRSIYMACGVDLDRNANGDVSWFNAPASLEGCTGKCNLTEGKEWETASGEKVTPINIRYVAKPREQSAPVKSRRRR